VLNIRKLGEATQEIGEIASVIDDISDQTNLLALNAAIEAARAGEHGRGFAVVADEVRKLAERTTGATKQIADMIKDIQKQTKEAVIAMEQGNKEVVSGIELTDKAGDALNRIQSSSQEVSDLITQIAAASEEQSATTEEISKNVVGISQATAESARQIEQVANTSSDLAQATEILAELILKFKIDKYATHNALPKGNAHLSPAEDAEFDNFDF
jgi:methyl-accepting chemotaxis protein